MKPNVEQSLLFDTRWVTQLVIVELESHELLANDKLELVAEIRDLPWVQTLNDLEELLPVTLTQEELLTAKGYSGNEDIRGLD